MPASTVRTVLLTLAASAAAIVAGAGAVISGGLYDVSAAWPHTQAVHSLLETAMRQSVRRQASRIDEPPLDGPALVQRGAVCFRDHCQACHGVPGQAPAAAALAMQPLPGPLQDAAGRWRARELAWIVRNGIRMSGMPAWGGRMDDADIWAVVAYLQWLRQASPALHAHTLAGLAQDDCALPAAAPGAAPAARLLVGLDGERQALRRHGCQGCHQVPGLVGSPSHVGPPLAGMARRTWIAGVLPNTPENLAAWIRDPQHHKPGSAMPALGVDARDAQLMAAYLGRLH